MKTLAPRFLIIFSISLISSNTFSQKTAESLNDLLNSYCQQLPMEKIYVHIDKPFYAAGDTIWFKAYLMDATTHRIDTASKIIYVDFIRKDNGKVISHKKLKNENGFAGSALALP